MKITLQNIGVFKNAEFEPGDLTIICGENNTGKTYATYSLYGFYDFWKNGFYIRREDSEISKLMETGSLTIPLIDIVNNSNNILHEACKQYSKYLPRIFAAQEKYFEHSLFLITLLPDEISILETYEKRWRTAKSELLQITKEKDKHEVTISLLAETNSFDTTSTRLNIHTAIGQALKEIIFGSTFSDIFIASAERTGAVIFKNELNLEKNIILKEVAGSSDIDLNEIFSKIYNSAYALPVKRNVDFIRKLDDIIKNESYISKEYPDLLTDFASIIGGEYKIGKDGLYYMPKDSKIVKLTMGESSSSVRSLLDVGFYLRYVAEKGDILMVDEPELNLHPSNQRKLAKLFARLINIGIKVFITTHSDYIIKEINTLIMLNNRLSHDYTKHLMKKFNYKETELLDFSRVKVYISEKCKTIIPGKVRKIYVPSLVPAEIDPFYGIEAKSFDRTIIDMNHIQESIILGR